MKSRTRTLLIITPGTCGGSWDFTYLVSKELVNYINIDNTYIIAGETCKTPDISKNTRYYGFNFRLFRLYIYSRLPDVIKGIIYSVLILPTAIFMILIRRPDIIILNGIAPLLFISLFINITSKSDRRSRIILSYHGTIHYNIRFKNILPNILNNYADVVLVNSSGVKEELVNIGVYEQKIFIITHVVIDYFFDIINPIDAKIKLGINPNSFTLSFIGHLTEEKLFNIYLYVISNLLEIDKEIIFIIVGEGPLEKRIKSMKIRYPDRVIYFGYVNDIVTLKLIYSASDIVWAYADETYIAKPGIEALSCGTPIIIPNVPAVSWKIEKNIKISRNIVPNDIGYILNIDNIEYITNFILKLKKNGIKRELREKCRNYAIEKHSVNVLSRNIKEIVSTLNLY